MLSPKDAANELLEVVPYLMKEIRAQMRSQRTPDLTVPQFRALAFVSRNNGASLSQLANHMGLTLPSTSRLVDVLIVRRFLTRQDNPSDRRRVKLSATNRGKVILENSRRTALSYLTKKLSGTTSEDRENMIQGMNVLRCIFLNNATS